MPPRVSRSRRNLSTADPADAESQESRKPNDGTDPAPATPPAVQFFDRIAALTEADWDHHLCYLYRVRPLVTNSTRHNYIDLYSRKFDESDVKEQHGGGGYKIIFKNKTEGKLLQEYFFDIEGEPKFKAGQKLNSPEILPAGTVPAAAPAPQTELASVLREVLGALQSKDSGGAEAAMRNALDLVKQGSTAGIEIMKQGIMKESGSMTGNPIMDKLMTAMLERMATPPPEKNSLKEALELLAQIRKMDGKDDREERSNPAGELGILKDLFGGENLMDLVKRGLTGEGGGGTRDVWKETLSNAGLKLVDHLPVIIQGVKDIIQQQVQIAMLRGGVPQPARAVLPANVQRQPQTIPAAHIVQQQQPNGVAVQSIAAQPAQVQPTQEEVLANIDRIKQMIVRCFDAGDDGDLAALTVIRSYPELVQPLQPFFADLAGVLQFATNDLILAPIVPEPGFNEYMEEFIARMKDPEGEPDGDGPDEVPGPTLVTAEKTDLSPGNKPA
ncbi:MAG: hypothetical protein JWO13_815 [Acidobacteriales bacterium]|nr:hypothetical protein [Terriglobales bacterium]